MKRESDDVVLMALYKKWWQDHRCEETKYPSMYCHWETNDRTRSRIPDEYFDELAERFSILGLNESVDSLEVGGLIGLFDTGLDMYYGVTEMGLAKIAELQKGAAVRQVTLSY